MSPRGSNAHVASPAKPSDGAALVLSEAAASALRGGPFDARKFLIKPTRAAATGEGQGDEPMQLWRARLKIVDRLNNASPDLTFACLRFVEDSLQGIGAAGTGTGHNSDCWNST